MPDGASSPDPIALLLLRVARSAAVRLGALAGAGSVIVTGAFIYLASLLPSRQVEAALAVRVVSFERVGTKARLVRSILTPWSGQITQSFPGGGPGSVSMLDGLVLIPTLVAVVTLVAAGLVVRLRMTGLRDRSVALGAAAVTTATITGVVAGAGSYSTFYASTAAASTSSIASVAATATLLTAVVGLFSFGVVAALREPERTAVRAGALATLVPLLVIGVVFTAWVATGPRHGPAPTVTQWVSAGQFGMATGSEGLPLAMGAPVAMTSTKGGYSPLTG